MSAQLDELDTVAGEYVLGLLSDEERDRFEARLDSDAQAQQALRSAQNRFAELEVTAHAGAPADLWARIEAGLEQPENVVPIRPRASERRPSSGLKFWHGFAAAAVLALIVFSGLWSSLSPGQPRLLVVLLDAQAQPGAIIEAYQNQQVRVVPLLEIEIPEGKTLEVWTKPNDEIGAVSLGLLEGGRSKILHHGDLPPPQPEQLYEITLENAGGSPTGKPTGQIIAKGFARAPQI